MPIRKLERDEIGRLGKQIYESKLRLVLEPQFDGQFVAIDVQTEEYEVTDEPENASDRLWERIPDAQILIERVGHRAAFHAYKRPPQQDGTRLRLARSQLRR